ncbi:CBM20 domain-containing protein [Spongiivirga citrea]|uniref:Uncharacterized protein n=1 Tax=Spongiivirga citrea TaxID=1481457 RepID=A0A6M0CM05_9FLAO|nr:hypothetical protein [Spongiivirga citrea]NER18968.1 hypothetical protein [Spongiivirga citrea]
MKIKNIVLLAVIASFFSSCVQEVHQKTVTFKVDVNGIENLNQVGLRGQMTDPSWQVTVPMTDEDKDGIYEVTLSEKTAVNSFEFKFVKNDGDYELRGQDNRRIQLEYKPQTILYEAVFNNPGGKQTVLEGK